MTVPPHLCAYHQTWASTAAIQHHFSALFKDNQLHKRPMKLRENQYQKWGMVSKTPSLMANTTKTLMGWGRNVHLTQFLESTMPIATVVLATPPILHEQRRQKALLLLCFITPGAAISFRVGHVGLKLLWPYGLALACL